MMINKRLIGTVSESKKYIAGNVALQWCSLAANMVLMTGIASLLAALVSGKMGLLYGVFPVRRQDDPWSSAGRNGNQRRKAENGMKND